MARSLSGWQGYPNVCYVCGERIYLSGPRATGAVFGIETSRHPECKPMTEAEKAEEAAAIPEEDYVETWGALPLGERHT